MAIIDYERNVHKHWMEVVRSERKHKTDEVIRQIKERFDRESITEVQLIEWGREFRTCPHAFVETLLYYGLDFD
ncbi:MAG: hypothetical protein OEX81_02955 [Candidatus Pacebacteria bacterium]|nr:hypothetical protein [Candidatus Paceibacterota bacterium]